VALGSSGAWRYRARMATLDLSPQERARRAQGVVALLFVQLFFGLFPLFGKLAFGSFAARSVAAWRIAVGGLVLGVVAALVHGRRFLPERGDLPRLALCGLLGILLNMLLFLEGLQRSSAIHVALLLPLIPVFTLIVAIVARQERFDLPRALGMAVAFFGAGLVLFERGGRLGSDHTLGNLLVVANELCYAIYFVLLRPLLAKYPPLVLTAWVFLLSAWSIPLLLGAEAPLVPEGAPTEAWLAILYIVIFPTIFTYLLNSFALVRVSASTAASFIFLQPMITVVGALWWLDEALPQHFVLSTLLTFGGVWVVARRPVARPLAPAAAKP
jgi:drug/metabolite transporter (DMT)-like permease